MRFSYRAVGSSGRVLVRGGLVGGLVGGIVDERLRRKGKRDLLKGDRGDVGDVGLAGVVATGGDEGSEGSGMLISMKEAASSSTPDCGERSSPAGVGVESVVVYDMFRSMPDSRSRVCRCLKIQGHLVDRANGRVVQSIVNPRIAIYAPTDGRLVQLTFTTVRLS